LWRALCGGLQRREPAQTDFRSAIHKMFGAALNPALSVIGHFAAPLKGRAHGN
jgi:hypothetical protein